MCDIYQEEKICEGQTAKHMKEIIRKKEINFFQWNLVMHNMATQRTKNKALGWLYVFFFVPFRFELVFLSFKLCRHRSATAKVFILMPSISNLLDAFLYILSRACNWPLATFFGYTMVSMVSNSTVLTHLFQCYYSRYYDMTASLSFWQISHPLQNQEQKK